MAKALGRMPPLEPWHDFFMLVGGAAATLLGVVFVAGSIAATIPNDKLGDERSRSLWVLPILFAFVRVLVVAAVGVVPGQTTTGFGYVLCALSLLDLARMGWVIRGMVDVHRRVEPLVLGDWGWYVAYPVLATASIAFTGLALAYGRPLPGPELAFGLVGHLIIGVHNAWELIDWLATRQ